VYSLGLAQLLLRQALPPELNTGMAEMPGHGRAVQRPPRRQSLHAVAGPILFDQLTNLL